MKNTVSVPERGAGASAGHPTKKRPDLMRRGVEKGWEEPLYWEIKRRSRGWRGAGAGFAPAALALVAASLEKISFGTRRSPGSRRAMDSGA